MKYKVHAINLHGLLGLVDQPSRRQDADAAVDHILTQPRVHIAFGAARQVTAKLVHRAPPHGRTHQHVFAGGLFHKTGRGHDGHFALRRILLGQDAQRAAKVVGMRMRHHQASHRLFAQVLLGKRHGRCCGLARGERIDHDPAGLAFDEGDVGNVKTA